MRQFLITSALVIFLASQAQAQIGYGFEVGFNMSDYNIKSNGNIRKTNFKNGGRAGILADIPINEDFVFQPGVYYVTNGFHVDLPLGYERYKINTFELPLNVQYAIGDADNNHIFVGAGPFLAYNRDGKFNIHSGFVDSERRILTGASPANDIRSLDIGAGVNVGYRLPMGLFVRLRAQMGFRNLAPKNTTGDDNKMRSMGFCLSGGYWFR
jgi:hypothetical protein